MNPFCRIAARALAHVGLASAVATLAAGPAQARTSPVTEVRAVGCPEPSLNLDWARAVLDAHRALPDGDDPRVAVALVLYPQFDGTRDFFEPRGFRTVTQLTWDYSPRVADDVATSTIEDSPDRTCSRGTGFTGSGSRSSSFM